MKCGPTDLLGTARSNLADSRCRPTARLLPAKTGCCSNVWST